jgi:hypothetical protein
MLLVASSMQALYIQLLEGGNTLEDIDNQKLKVFVTELIDALEEELEIENPFIPEDEKTLLVKYMVQDIFQREGYKPQFDFLKMNPSVIEKSLKGIGQEGAKIILH